MTAAQRRVAACHPEPGVSSVSGRWSRDMYQAVLALAALAACDQSPHQHQPLQNQEPLQYQEPHQEYHQYHDNAVAEDSPVQYYAVPEQPQAADLQPQLYNQEGGVKIQSEQLFRISMSLSPSYYI